MSFKVLHGFPTKKFLKTSWITRVAILKIKRCSFRLWSHYVPWTGNAFLLSFNSYAPTQFVSVFLCLGYLWIYIMKHFKHKRNIESSIINKHVLTICLRNIDIVPSLPQMYISFSFFKLNIFQQTKSSATWQTPVYLVFIPNHLALILSLSALSTPHMHTYSPSWRCQHEISLLNTFTYTY